MKLIRKSLSILLSVIMIVSVFTVIPIDASAQDGIKYIYCSWDANAKKIVKEERSTPYCGEPRTSTSEDLVADWYLATGSSSVNKRFAVAGNKTVNLILGDGATLTLNKGIRVDSGSTLNIYGQSENTGKLVVHMSDSSLTDSAAIGSNGGSNAGTINIHGGNLDLKAIKKSKAAVLGGGDKGSPENITIWDAVVKCDSENLYGAGIGGGAGAAVSQSNDTGVSIYGGTVTASSRAGAGIGSGDECKSAKGFINIYGGTVTGNGITGAGIGGGAVAPNCKINITGGVVTGVSTGIETYDSGAGIGSGQHYNQSEKITISNAKVSGTGSQGAGIGGGSKGDSAEIEISHSDVVAISIKSGAGIGGGNDGGDASKITITDSTVIANSYSSNEENEWKAALEEQINRTNFYIAGEQFYATALLIVSKFIEWFGYSISGAGIGGGEDGSFGEITITNSTIDAKSGGYSAAIGSGDEGGNGGTITLTGSTVTANSGTDTAAIGGGNECKVDTINITDSNVTARSDKLGSAIGGGDDAGFGTINISNSTVDARAGDYGAGIGTGEKSSDVGTINITDNSNIIAYGGKEAAGIGAGNEADGKVKVNISDSTVEAHGDYLGAGIGGGDDVSVDTISIDNSDVKAYGGQDAAGIGGGEDGNGGNITITDSTVYAEGQSGGAGIGNGEDGDTTSVRITGKSTVEALAGSDGDAAAIGHGNNGDFYSYHVNTYFSSELIVKAGSGSNSTNTYTGNNRYGGVWNNRYAKIYACNHTNTEWHYDNIYFHVKHCNDCGTRLGGQVEDHNWVNGTCSVCGAKQETTTVTFIEKDSSDQEIITTRDVGVHSKTEVPECTHVPEGYEFVCWAQDNYQYLISGEEMVVDSETVMKAVYLPVVETEYINADGKKSTVKARQLDTWENLNLNVWGLLLTDGWYVVDKDITFNKNFLYSDNVNLIIADGKTLSFKQSLNNDNPYQYDAFSPARATDDERENAFTVYGQTAQTGKINAGVRFPIFCNFVLNGAGFSFEGQTARASFMNGCTVNRGTFKGNHAVAKNLTINGGNVEINDVTVKDDTLLGWSELSDSIKLDGDVSLYGSVSVAENQYLQDEDEHTYTGTLSSGQINEIKGKTLTPFINHNYGEPKWVWLNEYKDATAVFVCSDCGEEQAVDAEVEYVDEDNVRTSTATCVFHKQTYTATHTTKLLWDVRTKLNHDGAITLSKDRARAGEDVQLSFTPRDGFALKSWKVVADDTSKEVETGYDVFTMPESDVEVSAQFVLITPRREPYLDASRDYHTGNIEYVEIDGEAYSVTQDRRVGKKLDSVELSDYEFELLPNSTYQINHFIGDAGSLTELEIPYTYNGVKITSIGNDKQDTFIHYTVDKTQFELILNPNIEKINQYTFYTLWVTKVSGYTKNLKTIGDYAFSWANEPSDYALEIDLDYEGEVSVGYESFNHMNVTVNLRHYTTLSRSDLHLQSLSYNFLDDHSYGEPEWEWSEDYKSATAVFTCSDSRCGYENRVEAGVSRASEGGKYIYTAAVYFYGVKYTDSREVDQPQYAITIEDSEHGTIVPEQDRYDYDDRVVLSVKPDPGYKLSSISVKKENGSEIELSGNDEFKFFCMPDSDLTVTATFEETDYPIWYSSSGCTVSGPSSAKYGDEVELTITPYTGRELSSITLFIGNNGTTLSEGKFTMPAAQVTVSVVCRAVSYDIFYPEVEHMSVSGASSARYGANVPLTISADDGYAIRFIKVTGVNGEECELSDNAFTMPACNVNITAEAVPFTPASEPYIDSDGDYKTGNVAYAEIDGEYYAVNSNGFVGEKLSSVTVSDFDFNLLGDDTYQITQFTGTQIGSELVIPKTYNHKKITVLGNESQFYDITKVSAEPFDLVLNENITEIKQNAFRSTKVTAVTGDASSLSTFGDYAFAQANATDENNSLDVKLDYEGALTLGTLPFEGTNLTLHLKHATETGSEDDLGCLSVTYDFTDAHPYGEPEWTWAEDHSSAAAGFTCTDPRCAHTETIQAEISESIVDFKRVYTASVTLDGKTYTSTREQGFNPLDLSYDPVLTAATATLTDKNLFDLPGELEYTKGRLLGVQTKETVRTDTEGTGLRFVAELSSEFVGKDNIDYGFEVVKTSKQTTADFNSAGGFGIMQALIDNNSGNIKSISCKNSSNNITGDPRYGDAEDTSTQYKYVTLAVTDIPDNQGIAVRFYVEIDGVRYYAGYTDAGNSFFRGCCTSRSALIGTATPDEI